MISKIGREDSIFSNNASELLNEVENTGLAVSETSSYGRHGYGTRYKLTISPEMVGITVFPDGGKV